VRLGRNIRQVRIVVAAAVAAVALGGCGEADPDELRAAARSLVPPSSRLLASRDGACVQLAPYPSCVELDIAPEIGSDRRVVLVRRAGRDNEWEARGEERSDRAVLLYFGRGPYEATVMVLADRERATCSRPEACPDRIRVVRR
jgi:hypothetical protein